MRDNRDTTLLFPIQLDGNGGLATLSGPAAVANSLRALLESEIGDHPYEPRLGWPIQTFAPVGDADVVAELIKDAIIDWEDRIDENNLRVIASIGDEGLLNVTIYYVIRGEATTRTLSHGFRILQ